MLKKYVWKRCVCVCNKKLCMCVCGANCVWRSCVSQSGFWKTCVCDGAECQEVTNLITDTVAKNLLVSVLPAGTKEPAQNRKCCACHTCYRIRASMSLKASRLPRKTPRGQRGSRRAAWKASADAFGVFMCIWVFHLFCLDQVFAWSNALALWFLLRHQLG
jgi:hypothetical protein